MHYIIHVWRYHYTYSFHRNEIAYLIPYDFHGSITRETAALNFIFVDILHMKGKKKTCDVFSIFIIRHDEKKNSKFLIKSRKPNINAGHYACLMHNDSP